MKRGTIILLAVLGVVLLILFSLYGWVRGTYNSLVQGDEVVKQGWAQVENQYQRRSDLIPNLVEVVKGYAAHESKVFIDVADARASVGRITVTPEVLNNPQAFQKCQEAQGALSSA